MDIDKAKHLIEGLYDVSLNCTCDDIEFHPIRILEASKSIIGIDLASPQVKLLEYCERYVSSFDSQEKNTDFSNLVMPSVVTFLDLELSIISKDKEKAYSDLYFLSRVSDGQQIVEFLLEFSLRYCSNSFLLIWSVYRMHLFLGFDNILKSLLVCLDFLLLENTVKRESLNFDIDDCLRDYEFNKNNLRLFFSLYRIGKDNFVRKRSILPLVMAVIKEKLSFSNKEKALVVSKNQETKGRNWISDLFSKIDFADVDNEMILNLDSCRGVLKILGGLDTELAWGRLNSIYEYR